MYISVDFLPFLFDYGKIGQQSFSQWPTLNLEYSTMHNKRELKLFQHLNPLCNYKLRENIKNYFQNYSKN